MTKGPERIGAGGELPGAEYGSLMETELQNLANQIRQVADALDMHAYTAHMMGGNKAAPLTLDQIYAFTISKMNNAARETSAMVNEAVSGLPTPPVET
jgi:hypothetical protein